MNDWLICWLKRTLFSVIRFFCHFCAFYLLPLNEFLHLTLTVINRNCCFCFSVLLALSSLSIKLLTDHFTQLNEKQLRLVQIKYLKLSFNIDFHYLHICSIWLKKIIFKPLFVRLTSKNFLLFVPQKWLKYIFPGPSVSLAGKRKMHLTCQGTAEKFRDSTINSRSTGITIFFLLLTDL